MEFVQRFQPVIAASVTRVAGRYRAASPALIDDLVQETYLRLCQDQYQALRRFKATHEESIFGFIKVVAINVALDHFRARMTGKRRPEVEDDGEHGECAQSEADIEQTALLNQLERMLEATEPERNLKIFQLYYREGYTAKEIAEKSDIGLAQKGVEACLYRLTQALRASVQGMAKGKSPEPSLGVMK